MGITLPMRRTKSKGVTCIRKKRHGGKEMRKTKRAPRREPGSIRAMEGTG